MAIRLRNHLEGREVRHAVCYWNLREAHEPEVHQTDHFRDMEAPHALDRHDPVCCDGSHRGYHRDGRHVDQEVDGESAHLLEVLEDAGDLYLEEEEVSSRVAEVDVWVFSRVEEEGTDRLEGVVCGEVSSSRVVQVEQNGFHDALVARRCGFPPFHAWISGGARILPLHNAHARRGDHESC